MGGHEPVRVTLVGDDELVRAGLATMLAPLAHRTVLVNQRDEHAAADRQNGRSADITLVDPFRPGGAGLDVVRDLVRDEGAPPVVIYTYRRDPADVDAALAAGASAYLSKAASASELVADLERVAAGEKVVPAAVPEDDRPPGLRRWALTEREADVAVLLARGMRNADIAGALHISLNTVKTHLRSLFRKLGVSTRAQAVIVVLGANGYGGQPSPPASDAPKQ